MVWPSMNEKYGLASCAVCACPFIVTRTSRIVIIAGLFIALIKFDSEDVVMRALLNNVGYTTTAAGYLILRIIPERRIIHERNESILL